MKVAFIGINFLCLRDSIFVLNLHGRSCAHFLGVGFLFLCFGEDDAILKRSFFYRDDIQPESPNHSAFLKFPFFLPKNLFKIFILWDGQILPIIQSFIRQRLIRDIMAPFSGIVEVELNWHFLGKDYHHVATFFGAGLPLSQHLQLLYPFQSHVFLVSVRSLYFCVVSIGISNTKIYFGRLLLLFFSEVNLLPNVINEGGPKSLTHLYVILFSFICRAINNIKILLTPATHLPTGITSYHPCSLV